MEFSESQVNRVAEIFKDIAQVSLASVVIPYLIDRSNSLMLVLGVVLTAVAWFLSVRLTK